MTNSRNWSNLSFTPSDSGSPVPIRSATITFPAADHLFEDNAPENPAVIEGSTFIRIRSSNQADVPKFPVGQIGVFQGVFVNTGLLYTAYNAEVQQSEEGDLILEASSLDGCTYPVSFSIP